jgi:hypothetical protein
MTDQAQDRSFQLKALGVAISDKRADAVSARRSSGIEAVWLKAEEAYLGIDDANRNDFSGAKWAKPTSMSGGLQSETTSNDNKSNVFVRLTSRYVDAGAAKLAEILLPADQKPFSFGPSPVPDLVKGKDDDRPLTHAMTGEPIVQKTTKEEQQAGAGEQKPVTPADIYKDTMARAKKAAQKAEERIYDWMVECNFAGENRKVIFDAARLGVGVLKAPIPEVQTSKSLSKQGNVARLEFVKKVVPVARWMDVWNLFPDPACGEDIHNGDYVFDRDHLSPKSVKQLIGQDGYLTNQILKVLKEGPGKCNEGGDNPSNKNKDTRFEVWYFYGTLTREELASAYTLGDLAEDKDDFYVLVTMINDSVIRAIINPMESGSFPHRVMPWSRRSGHWAGVGIAEQCDMPQRTINAATRSLLNNAGLSSGGQIVIDQGSIIPANGKWEITPNKVWWKTGETPAGDVRQLFMVVDFPNIGPRLMEIIQYAFKLAEESTSIPLITQGQTGATTPETLGAVQLQNNNAATLLRSIGYHYDDFITEPTVNAFYEWLLLDPDVPDEEKGDFKINAHGSAAMVERAVQEITLSSMGQMALNPAFGIDPKKWFAEWMIAKRLDPTRMQYTEEEQKKMAEQEAPPPIQIQVAQLRAKADADKQAAMSQADLQLVHAKAQLELAAIQQEATHERGRLQAGHSTPHITQATARIEQERIKAASAQAIQASRASAELNRAQKEIDIAQQNGEHRIQELQLKKELALLEYSQKHNMSLEQVKANLAKTAMQEQTKRELASAERQLAISEGDKDRNLDLRKNTPSLVRDQMSTDKTP